MQDVHVKLNPGLSLQKQRSTRKTLFFTSKLDFNFNNKLVKYDIWSTALYGPETGTIQNVDRK